MNGITVSFFDILEKSLHSGTLITYIFTFLMHIYLYKIEKKNYIKLWMLGWGIQIACNIYTIIRLSMHEALPQPGYLKIDILISSTLIITGKLFILWGTYSFMERKFPVLWAVISGGIVAANIAISAVSDSINILFNMPFFIFTIIANIYLGMMFLRNKAVNKSVKRIMGFSYILFGLNILYYLLVSPWKVHEVWTSTAGEALFYSLAFATMLLLVYSLRRIWHESEHRFGDVFKYSATGMAIVGLDGKWLKVNSSLCGILGYTEQELLKMTFQDITYPDDLSMGVEHIKQASLGEICYYHMEKRYIHKNGRIIWVMLSVSTVCDIKGAPLYFISQIQDITEKKASEELIRESEKKYRGLIEQSIDGIIVVNQEGCIIEFSKGMENITGLKKEEVLGRACVDIYRQVMPDNVKGDFNDENKYQEAKRLIGMEGVRGKIFEGVIQSTDGTRRNIQELSYLVRTKDGCNLCSIIRDVTELKKVDELKSIALEKEKMLKEAQEYDKIRTEFFANLSHELRTPLNLIFSSIQLLNNNFSEMPALYNDKSIKTLKTARQNCYRLMRLINNLIDATKMDAGFFELNMKECNIVNIIEDITLSVAEFTAGKNINLVFDTDIEEKIMACDPDMIERIVLNLLSNAIKFTHSGGSIYVNINDCESYIALFVEDTGIGIPENKLEHIFERFTQVDKSLTRRNEGSGIGLSIVKSLVELHQGNISVESEDGKGTKFIIQLPVRFAEVKSCKSSDKYYNVQNSQVDIINIEFSDIYM